jgi:hypothetical protein
VGLSAEACSAGVQRALLFESAICIARSPVLHFLGDFGRASFGAYCTMCAIWQGVGVGKVWLKGSGFTGI